MIANTKKFKQKQDIFSFFNLITAYYQCRQSKRKSRSAAEFEIDFEKKLILMQRDLRSQTYACGQYICFAITDPKIREVWAADFRDRIIHHLLVNYLEPIWEKKFVFHSYACRSGKGAYRAFLYLKKAIRNFDYKNRELWYLKIDIESFFMNINKQILFEIIKKRISNPDILWLSKLIIFQDPTLNHLIKGDMKTLASVPKHKSLFYVPRTQGLPIGNYTSQFFANLYLNEVDQFVKHTLKCNHYFRYMDDLILVHPDKNRLLRWRDEISDFLNKKLLLRLHPGKQVLQPVKLGIDFLGYVVKPDYAICRRRIVSNLKKKLHYFNKILDSNADPRPEHLKYVNGNVQLNIVPGINHSCQPAPPFLSSETLPDWKLIAKAQCSINSYYGHFRHAHCKKLRMHLYFGYFKNLKKYLKPADKNFSHFIFHPSIKELYQEKKETIRGETPTGTGYHC